MDPKVSHPPPSPENIFSRKQTQIEIGHPPPPLFTPQHCIQMFRSVEIIEKLKVNITETKGYDLLLNVLGLGVPGTHYSDQVSEAIPLTACGGKYFFRSSGA